MSTPRVRKKKKPLGSVAFVGAGPGDPGLLTVRGRDLLERADVVVAEVPDASRSSPSPTDPASRSSTAASARTASRWHSPSGPSSCSRRSRPASAWSGCSSVTRSRTRPVPRRRSPASAPVCVRGRARRAERVGRACVRRDPADREGRPRGPGRERRRLQDRLVLVRRRSTLVLLAAVRTLGSVAEGLIAAGRPSGHAGRGHVTRHDHVAADGRLDAAGRRCRRRGGSAHHAGGDGRRLGRRAPREAVVVRDQAAVRLARARAADQGPGRSDAGRARLARRGRVRGADDRGRAAADAAADGEGDPRPGRGPLRVGRVHVGQRAARRTGEVRGVRARCAGVLRPQDRRRR